MTDDRAARLAEYAEAMALMLVELEWSGGDGTCPWCEGEMPEHEEGCDLEALLANVDVR
jgi:hypothetical protein